MNEVSVTPINQAPVQPASGGIPPSQTTESSGNLNDDLENALISGGLEFEGSYYHCSTDPNAPNPGLTIDGLGLVGLPLSERDAKLIISRSTQAPFGKGNETVVDTTVRDTWEIEPAHLSFRNPKWATFIEQLGSEIIPTSLGVTSGVSKPRCELYKLLLYQTGSHFSAHQDTSKADGMFATVVVVLPSAFEGGEVHVSHARQKAVLEVSKDSAFSTSILGWYTDVVHEVKPITSGYRLALSYNLVHTSTTGAPPPSLPNSHSGIEAIHRVLTKWKEGTYGDLPPEGLIAYLLSHEYSLKDFEQGLNSLKGSDAWKLAQLLPIAMELGFTACFANLQVAIEGKADDNDGWDKRARWDKEDSDEDSDEEPDMLQVESQSNTLSNLTRVVDGTRFCPGSFDLDAEALVPRDPFDGEEPDRKRYEVYMGNGAGSLEHWYDRSVLVLFRDEDDMKVMVGFHGIAWAVQELKTTPNQSTPRTRKIATAVLEELQSYEDVPDSNPNTRAAHVSNALALMRYAGVIKDVRLWNAALPCSRHALPSAMTAITEALGVFDLPSLRPGLDGFVIQTAGLEERFRVIDAVKSHVGGDGISAWADALKTEVAASYADAEVKDIPTLFWVAEREGLGFIYTMLTSNILKKSGTYAFLIEFIKTFHQNRSQFPQPATDINATSPVVDVASLIRLCTSSAAEQWEANVSRPPDLDGRTPPVKNSQTIDRICELVDLCLSFGDLDPCSRLLNAVLGVKDKAVFATLVPRLKSTLDKFNIKVTDEPFKSFLKDMFSLYMVHVLGTETVPPTFDPNPKPIGCGCADCKLLDAFMKTIQPSMNFSGPEPRKTHLETRVRQASLSHNITCNTARHKKSYQLVISRRPEVVAAFSWKSRQGAAADLVRVIGEKEASVIMGHKWEDMSKAIQESLAVGGIGGAGSEGVSAQAGPSTPAAVVTGGKGSAGVAPVAGKKRKRRDRR